MKSKILCSSVEDNGQNKIIKYRFVNGETADIEISGELAKFLVECDRKEHALDEYERSHTYSLDAIIFEGLEYSSGTTPETERISEIERKHILERLSLLTETQLRRITMLSSGFSLREIARSEHVDVRAIFECIEAARKKFGSITKVVG